MASEGLNLHFQAHRLFHFDLPWSLLRFQQRNGRIDRYGQDREPQIYYFVGESSHERVRNMWVLEKLVEKDEAAQSGLGDPAVFLGGGDIELEEEVVAEAVARGIGAERFEAEMDERASSATTSDPADDWDVLFGEFTGASQAGGNEGASYSSIPPRLFSDTFSYTCAVLRVLVDHGQGVLASDPRISSTERMIVLEIPEDMKGDGSFGYIPLWEAFLDRNPRCRIAMMMSEISEAYDSSSWPYDYEDDIAAWVRSGFPEPSLVPWADRIQTEGWRQRLADAAARAGEGWVYYEYDVYSWR